MELVENQNQSLGRVPTTKKLLNLLNSPFEKGGILVLSALFFDSESHRHYHQIQERNDEKKKKKDSFFLANLPNLGSGFFFFSL